MVYDLTSKGKRQLVSGYLDDICTRINDSVNQVYLLFIYFFIFIFFAPASTIRSTRLLYIYKVNIYIYILTLLTLLNLLTSPLTTNANNLLTNPYHESSQPSHEPLPRTLSTS